MVLIFIGSPSVHADPTKPGKEVRPELFVEGAPDVSAATFDGLAPYNSTRSASFSGWVAGGDGGMLIRTRFGQTTQVHRVTAPGHARQQLTFGKEPVRLALDATWKRERGLLLLRDVGGAEAYQLFFQSLANGRHTQLTSPRADGKPSRTTGLILSRDGRWLALSNTQRNGKDYDLYIMDLSKDSKPRRIMEAKGYWSPIDWSPDSEELLALNYVSANSATLWRVNAKTGARRELAPVNKKKHRGLVYTGTGRYAADGKGVYFVSNRWGQFRQLGHISLTNGKVRRVAPAIQWDIESIAVDPSGKRLAFSYNEGGASRLQVRALKPIEAAEKLPRLPVGILRGLRFDDAGQRLALTINGPKTAGDCYVLNIGEGAARLVRWTASEVGGLDTPNFIAPTLVDFQTFDRKGKQQRRIPAFYYRPRGQGPFPVVVAIHGGPESQFRPWFRAVTQHWVRDLGIAVVAPNVRGSAGYGKDYLLLDNGFKREDSVKDIGALLKWIAKQPELDAKRVAVYGGSYGGYMVLASMAHFSDRIVAGAEAVGISNFVTFLKNTKAYRRDLRRAEYGDERDPKMRAHLEKISPTNLVHRIKAPLMVAQGLNDPRVPASESAQIVAGVRKAGIPVWYLLARDEGHGFRKKKNRDYYYGLLTEFWKRHLLAPKR